MSGLAAWRPASRRADLKEIFMIGEIRRRLALGAALVAVVGLVPFAGCATSPQEGPDGPGGGRTVVERDRDGDATMTILDMIRREVPNVVVQERGGTVVLQLRGPASFSGVPNDALVVIDGVIQASANAVLDVNPADVRRIEVLRDGAAAMYGSRGANGVVSITTRR
jgi:TonB-dependent SusC/RagA subfamily outer membrane receptor